MHLSGTMHGQSTMFQSNGRTASCGLGDGSVASLPMLAKPGKPPPGLHVPLAVCVILCNATSEGLEFASGTMTQLQASTGLAIGEGVAAAHGILGQ